MTRGADLPLLGFTLFLLVLSAGAFGFVDILALGVNVVQDTTNVSGFAKVQWPVAYGLFILLTIRHWPAFEAALLRAWPMLLWPALALFSFLWTINANATVNSGGRFLVTIAMGILLGCRLDLMTLLRLVFWTLLITVGLSALLVLAGVDFAVALDGGGRGLFFHKNMLGARAALLFLAAGVLWLSRWRRGWSLLGVATALFALVVSRSATAIVETTALLVIFPFLTALRRPTVDSAFTALIGLLTLAVLITGFALLNNDSAAVAAGLLDRDIAMSGRLELWQAGAANFWDRPLLGSGFDAYWPNGIDWRLQIVLEELGYVQNFHNTFLEAAIQLGAIGLVLVAGLLLLFIGRSLTALARYRHPLFYWPPGLALLLLVGGTTEYAFFAKHALMQILLVALYTQVTGLVPAAPLRPLPLTAAAPGE